MKSILFAAAAAALAIVPVGATTPTELIERMHARTQPVTIEPAHTSAVHTRSAHAVPIRPARTHAAKARTVQTRPAHVPAVHSKRVASHTAAHRHARKRTFGSLREYRRLHRVARTPKAHASGTPVRHARHSRAHAQASHAKRLGHYVGNGWFVDDHGQYDEQYQPEDPYQWVPSRPIRRQHAYRHYRRQWYLTYLYEHAEFDDKHGYHYGYFDRRGFVFDGQYYAYDRAYTYQDRLHGKGLFEHRFYRPNHRYARERSYRYDDGRTQARIDFYWQF